MPVALNPNKLMEYILKGERQSEVQTTFLIRPLSGIKMSRVLHVVNKMDQKSAEGMDNAIQIVLEIGLAGWRNFNDEEGKPVDFKTDSVGKPLEETLGKLDFITSTELLAAVVDLNKIGSVEQGK